MNINKMTNKDISVGEGDITQGDKIVSYTNINIQYTPNEAIKGISNKIDYKKFFKSYILGFEELEFYLFKKIFSFDIAEYKYTSNHLIFGTKIIDWILGESSFPVKEIDRFYSNLKVTYDIQADHLIYKRWEAMRSYIQGDVERAKNLYLELLDSIEKTQLDNEWFIDDILIDGRNIYVEYYKQKGIIKVENPFQDIINKNKHQLSNPDIDRINSNIFNETSKNIISEMTKSKGTIRLGSGLEYIFKDIQNIIYLTILYGSITHLTLSRKTILNTLQLYSTQFEDVNLYKTSLKMLLLRDDKKGFYNLLKTRNYDYSIYTDGPFIKELYNIVSIYNHDNSISKKIIFLNLLVIMLKMIFSIILRRYFWRRLKN